MCVLSLAHSVLYGESRNFDLIPSPLALTSEEIREKRRAERKQFKLDRARAMAQAAEEAENAFREGRQANVVAIPSGATWRPQQPPQEIPQAEQVQDQAPEPEEEDDEDDVPLDEEPLEDVEHLQLTFQEAFFLVWNLDCLTLWDPKNVCVTRLASLLFYD